MKHNYTDDGVSQKAFIIIEKKYILIISTKNFLLYFHIISQISNKYYIKQCVVVLHGSLYFICMSIQTVFKFFQFLDIVIIISCFYPRKV